MPSPKTPTPSGAKTPTPPPAPSVSPAPTGSSPKVELAGPVAALVLNAQHQLGGLVTDRKGNQAKRMIDGSIRLSMRQKDGSHELL